MQAPSCLVALDVGGSVSGKRLAEAVAAVATASPAGCYILWTGANVKEGAHITTSTLDLLGELMNAAALVQPQLMLVPLLPCCGWTPGAVAALPSLTQLLDVQAPSSSAVVSTTSALESQATASSSSEAAALLAVLTTLRPSGLPPLSTQSIQIEASASTAEIGAVPGSAAAAIVDMCGEAERGSFAGTGCSGRLPPTVASQLSDWQPPTTHTLLLEEQEDEQSREGEQAQASASIGHHVTPQSNLQSPAPAANVTGLAGHPGSRIHTGSRIHEVSLAGLEDVAARAAGAANGASANAAIPEAAAAVSAGSIHPNSKIHTGSRIHEVSLAGLEAVAAGAAGAVNGTMADAAAPTAAAAAVPAPTGPGHHGPRIHTGCRIHEVSLRGLEDVAAGADAAAPTAAATAVASVPATTAAVQGSSPPHQAPASTPVLTGSHLPSSHPGTTSATTMQHAPTQPSTGTPTSASASASAHTSATMPGQPNQAAEAAPTATSPAAPHTDIPTGLSMAAPAKQLLPHQLEFARVAVGGTFDRLHAGHLLLLAATAMTAMEQVYIGVTADALLASKAYKDVLQSYEQRSTAAQQYVEAVRPGLQVQAGALTDPKAPTQAELDPHMSCLVVSAETLPGANKINAGRHAAGFAPLRIVVVPVIGCSKGGGKLSSTELRKRDAMAQEHKQ